MTCVLALRYLDLPSTVLMADAVQPLADAAKQYLAARFKDMTKWASLFHISLSFSMIA